MLYALLAQANINQRYMHLGDKFRKTGTEVPPTVIVLAVLLVAAVVGLLWLLAVWITGRETRAHYNNPRALFRALCRAHQLNRKDQRLLKAVVDRRCATQPAELFVEPQYLLDAAEETVFRSRRAELLALRQRLFEADAG